MKKSQFGKVEVEVVYCVPCGYQAVAMWMLTEFWRSQNAGDIAIKLTPDSKGKLEVYLDGEKIYDKKEEGVYPNLTRVNELKMVIADRVFEIEEEVAAGV